MARGQGAGCNDVGTEIGVNLRDSQINYISKAPGLPDAPVTVPGRQFQSFGDLSVNRPRVHDFLKEMHREVLSHFDCFA